MVPDPEANFVLPRFHRLQFGKTFAANGRGGDCAHEAERAYILCQCDLGEVWFKARTES